MTFELVATAQPSNEPPRVELIATESDPDLSLQTVSLFRDGVPLRFEPAVTGDSAIAYDYDAPFGVSLVYRADATELGVLDDWVEDWASLADWSGSGWSVGSGVASSTTPGGVLYRDVSTGSIIQLDVVSPSNLTVQLTDDTDNIVASVLVSPDGTVTLTGSTASKVTGSGSFTVTLSEGTVAIAGTGWSTSVGFTGSPTRVRLVAPAVATFVSKFGSTGSGNGQLSLPSGVATDSSGNLWVTDSLNRRVQVFDATGAFLFKFGSSGAGDGQFGDLAGIAIDASDRAWVVDYGNRRVQVFDATGAFLFKFGSAGSGNGQFGVVVNGIAIDSSGNAWVADTSNNRVQKFDSAGTYVSKFGTAGTGDGQLVSPQGLAFTSGGDLWVVDGGNDRVQRFNSSGVYQAKFGSSGAGDGQFTAPYAIAIDGTGAIWVGDFNTGRIQKFNSSGVYQAKFGSSGAGDGQFGNITDIAVDSADGLWITDSYRNRLQEFTTDVGSTDDITARIALDEPLEVTATDDATLTPTGDTEGAWLTNAAIPDLAVRLVPLGASSDGDHVLLASTKAGSTLLSKAVALEIEGSPYVLTVNLGPRALETWSMDVACLSDTARRELLALLANDSPISIRFPTTGYESLDGGFYTVGDVNPERIGHPSLPHADVISLPLTPARAPKFKPLWEWNWDTLAQTGMTWDDVNTAFDSWNDLLLGPG